MIKELILSFLAGIAAFISPCVLPLIPAYVFYITGLKASEKVEDKLKYIIKILLFVLGFSIIFVTLGIITVLLTFTVKNIRFYLNIIFGIIIIIFSFHFMGIINILFLNKEKRFEFNKIPSGYIGSLLIGMAFAAGWTPCIGPVLGSILGLVATGDSITKGVILLSIFSLGLGLPFIITALFFNYMNPIINFLKKHSKVSQIISGIILLFIGILILLGSLNSINIYLNKFAYYLEDTMPTSNYIFSIILIILGLLFIIPMFIKKKFFIAMIIFFILFLTTGILNLINILPLLKLFIKYLSYQGL